jgi:flagellar motor switch protein FliG
MNSPSKKKVWLALVIGLMLMQSVASVRAQENVVKEEAYTLENIYQEKAHQTLNPLMNADDYTIVVSATIRNDEAKLKEYREMVERRFMPGLSMNDPAGFGEEHNLLHALKQKVEVQVVLSEKVPADRDALVKDLLRSKLKLSDEMGDVITVSRAAYRAPASETLPKKLPEFSNKMMWLLVALAGIAAIALAYWVHRRREENRKHESVLNASFEEKEKIRQAIQEEEQRNEDPAKVGKTPEEIEMEARLLKERIQSETNSLVKLSQEHLTIVMSAIEEYMAAGFVDRVTLVFESIGWDESRRLYKGIPPKVWNRVATNLRDRTEDPKPAEVFEAVHEFNRFALSHVLEKAGNNVDNPFAFIFKLSPSNRIDLLKDESAYHIGLISIYCTGAQMWQLMDGLPQEKRDEIFFHISKIRNLPEAEVTESVNKLLSRMESIRKAPSIHIDGLGIAARFIRSLDPLKEEELYRSIQEKHPEQSEQLRRAQVMFDDVPYYPQEMVRKIVANLDAQDVVSALAGYPSEFVEAFVSMMPTKKAMMIQNDLVHMSDLPAPYQGALARRNIALKLEEEFEKSRFDIAQYWDMQSQSMVQAEEESVASEPVASESSDITEEPTLQLVKPEEAAPEGEVPASEQEATPVAEKEPEDDKKESA